MVKHMLLWNFRAEVDDETRAAVIAEINSLPTVFPQMRNWTLGANVSTRDQTFGHAFVVEFDSIDELDAYLTSAHHEDFVANRWRQHIQNRAIVSYEYLQAAVPEGARS